MDLKELLEKRAELAKTICQMAEKINTEKRAFTAEEQTNWEKVNKDYDELTRQVDIAQRVATIDAEQRTRSAEPLPGRDDTDPARDQRDQGRNGATGAITEETRATALQGWMRAQSRQELEQRHVDACRTVRLNPNSPELVVPLYRTHDIRRMSDHFRSVHPSEAQRALSAFTGTAGAFTTVPETLLRSLEIAMLQFGGVRQVAEILRTTSGEPLSWPTANDTTNKGRRIAENTTVDTTGAITPSPTFGKTTWFSYKYTSDAILVPTELLQDSVFDLPMILGGMLGERLGRITNNEDTIGNGNAMPQGIATSAPVGVTAAKTTSVTTDELIKLIHSIDPAYRNGPGVGFMLHDQSLLNLRLLKDGEGRYIWQPGMQASVPDRLFNYPYTVNQDMPQMTTGNKSTLFGDLSKYKIRDVADMRLYRLQERYRDSDQDGFVAFLRHDAGPLNAGTNPIKAIQQA